MRVKGKESRVRIIRGENPTKAEIGPSSQFQKKRNFAKGQRGRGHSEPPVNIEQRKKRRKRNIIIHPNAGFKKKKGRLTTNNR